MSEKLKINIVIAGRSYPLSVSSTQEEEGMRKAAANINQLISLYEQNYAVIYNKIMSKLGAKVQLETGHYMILRGGIWLLLGSP